MASSALSGIAESVGESGDICESSKKASLVPMTAICRSSGPVGGGGRRQDAKNGDGLRGMASDSGSSTTGTSHPLEHASHQQTRSRSLNSAVHPQRRQPHSFGSNAIILANALRLCGVRTISKSHPSVGHKRNRLVSLFQYTFAVLESHSGRSVR